MLELSGVFVARGGSSEEGTPNPMGCVCVRARVCVCVLKDNFLWGSLWEHNGMVAKLVLLGHSNETGIK